VLLQDAEELGLGLGRKLTDLVEENRPPIGQLEPARVPGDGPGEGPFSWPNSSLSTRPAGRAAQLTLISGLSRRRLFEWTARAISSLPVPVSPQTSTVASVGATRPTLSKTASRAGLRPMISSKLWTDLISSWR
jgi:hypothetical protein